jgi:shikimate kinase
VPDTKANRPKQSIALVGFMAAGKSRIGSLLAARLGLPFVDTDELIEQAFGLTVADIFRRSGESVFRRLERDTIGSLLIGDAQVIAIGGGAFVDPEIRDALNRGARTIWLDPPFELIAERLARSNGRPLAAGKSVLELRHLWEERRKSYAQAHLHIETDGDPQRFIKEIVKALGISARPSRSRKSDRRGT